MTDVSTAAAAPVPPPPAPPASAAAPVAAPGIDYAALAKELAPLLQPASAQAPAPVENTDPPSPVNLFEKGNIVEYAWNDPYDGPSSQYGIVVDTLPDEGAGARSVVAWFRDVSGPIGDHQLSGV